MARFNLWTRLRSAFSLCIHASSTVWPGQTNSTAQLFLTVGLFFGICQLGSSLAMAHRLLSIPEETTCWNKYDHKPFDYDRAFGTGSSSSPASPYDYGFWSQVKHLPVTYANLGYAAAADDMKTMISGPVVMKMGLPGRGGGAATIVIALIVNPLLLFFYLIWLARRQTHGYLSNRNAMLNSFCFTALFAFNSASMSVLDTLPNSEATGTYELCWQEDIVMHDLAKLGKWAEWVVVWGILNGTLGGLSMAFYFVNCIKAAQMNRSNDDGIVGLQDLGPSSSSSNILNRNNNHRTSRNHNHDVERTAGLAPPAPTAQSATAANTRGLNRQDSLVSREPKTKSKTVKPAKPARNERNGDLGVRQRSEEREGESEIVNPFTCPENVIQDDDDEDVEVGRRQGGRA